MGLDIRKHIRAMGGFLIIVALLFAQAASIAAAAQTAGHWTLETVLRQLDIEAKTFQSLTADIERTKVTVVVNDHSTESGQIFVRRDGKMRIDFTNPDPRTILRTGNDLFLYNPKANQVEQFDLSKHRSMVDQFLLLGFGTSGGDLDRGYLVTLVGEENLGGRKTVKLELTPKSDEVRNQVSKIDIWMDESTWLPAQQQFFETGSGDYLLIAYSNIARNPRLSDNEFKQNWPKGVTHVKPQG